ncbi:MAG: hypothetical protein GC180_06240 [Bacteroidetes bacterium]|nr:hypothetical protein [Bacteroidota bacterium]
MLDKQWEAQLDHLRGELILMKASIRETALEIMQEGYSKFPIFIAHQDEVKVGEVILDKSDMATLWSISASTLEEFQEKNLIPAEKIDFFKANYKNPKEQICLFVVYGAQAHFVFIPYKNEPHHS